LHLGYPAGFSWATPALPSARLQWQVKPLGSPLSGAPIQSGDPQTLNGSTLVFGESASFPQHQVQHWRARLRTNNPVFPVTPWVWLPGNGMTEAKLRVGPPPPVVPGDQIPGMPGRAKK